MEDMIAGARVEVAPYKRDPAISFCGSRAMVINLDGTIPLRQLGAALAGISNARRWRVIIWVRLLTFMPVALIWCFRITRMRLPSHAAHDTDIMAKYWLHNGFVTMGDEKMSKSLGNLVMACDAIGTHRGETVRAGLLAAHYRAPVALPDSALVEARNVLDRLYRAVGDASSDADAFDSSFVAALCDDLNTPAAMARLHELAGAANKGDGDAATALEDECGSARASWSDEG